jgi:hypothetical protein
VKYYNERVKMNEVMRTAYYFVVLGGATIEKNRVTLYKYNGIICRWQVYSDRYGKYFDGVFTELDTAIDKFMELSV